MLNNIHMLNNSLLGCSGREGVKNSILWNEGTLLAAGEICESKDFVNLWGSHPNVSVWPHTCACALCRGGGCTDPESHPVISTIDTQFLMPFQFLTQVSSVFTPTDVYTRQTQMLSLQRNKERSRGAEYPTSPQVCPWPWCKSQQPHALVALHWGDSLPRSPGQSSHNASTLKHQYTPNLVINSVAKIRESADLLI